MSDAWSDRLSEYLDDELSLEEAKELELHINECESCRGDLVELRLVAARLASDRVRTADQPTDREWQAIRRSIRTARFRWLIPTTIAAALAGLVTVGAIRSLREPHIDADAAVSAVYAQATGELETILRENLTNLRPETISALEASMTAIDSAIAQTERALATDPGNDYVFRSMGQLRDARLTALRQAVSVATSEEL